MDVKDARAVLESAGYVVVKGRTYRGWQERVRIADALREAERERRESTERWAHGAFDELRRVDRRLAFVYGEARAAGCTIEQLSATKEQG